MSTGSTNAAPLFPGMSPDATAHSDFGGPDPAALSRAIGAGRFRLELLVKGAKCAGCIRKIESGLLAWPGVTDARLNLSTGRLVLTWAGAATLSRALVRELQRLGFEAQAFDPGDSAATTDEEGRALLRRLAVAGFATMNIMLFSVPVWAGVGEMGPAARGFLHWISALIAVPAGLYAAQPFFSSALRALKAGRANMDVPISLGVLLTLATSLVETALGGAHAFFDGAVMLLFFLLIGRWLDHLLRQKARSAARDLLALQAITAERIEADGALRPIAARDIRRGDDLRLAPGDRVPVDAIVLDGRSELDHAILTGETAPVAVGKGDSIAAGAVNLGQSLTIRAERTADQSTLAQLARLIELGEQGRSRYRRIADRAAALYVPFVHSAAALTLLGWLILPPLLAQWGIGIPVVSLREAVLNAVAVLIITCPCALGLAVPAVQIVATGHLFRRGVLVKSGDALERLAAADHIVMDKTGTLTLGRPRLLPDADPGAVAAAALLARGSHHPLSRALSVVAGPGPVAPGIVEIPGDGLEARCPDGIWRLGRRDFAIDAAFVTPSAAGQNRVDTPPGPELWFQRPGHPPICFRFEDELRADAAGFVAAMKQRGLSVELLSGDRWAAVASSAQQAGIGHFTAEISPSGKVEHLARLRAAGHRVFMIGDGLNDSAALAAGFVSATPGSAVHASQAAADLVFQGADLAPVVQTFDIARAAMRRVRENLGFAVVYNLCAIPVAVLGLVTPLVAAIAMSASSLVVMLNSLRVKGGAGRWTS